MPRQSWFSEGHDTPRFDEDAARAASWRRAIADGAITPDELRTQADRVAGLLRALEAEIDDALHERLATLFVEWAVLQRMSAAVPGRRGDGPTGAGAQSGSEPQSPPPPGSPAVDVPETSQDAPGGARRSPPGGAQPVQEGAAPLSTRAAGGAARPAASPAAGDPSASCASCGNPLPERASFCPTCGARRG